MVRTFPVHQYDTNNTLVDSMQMKLSYSRAVDHARDEMAMRSADLTKTNNIDQKINQEMMM